MLNAFEVIWLPDTTARGQRKTRMMVCLVPDEGFFLRINSDKRHVPNTPLLKHPLHSFLERDSFVECNLLTISDDWIEEAISNSGVVGFLDPSMIEPILDALRQSRHLRQSDFDTIELTLREI